MSQKEPTNIIIKCPKCGKEYLWSEIFYPDDIGGKPTQIVKDPLGKILYVSYTEGYEPTYSQTFICEECNETFIIDATVSVKVRTAEDEVNFTNQYVSLLD